MTEPVAYLAKSRTTETVLLTTRKYSSDSFENIPLYTKEQLHQRVKMTQAEFDEWFKLYDKKSFLIPIHFLKLISNLENGYPLICNIYLEGREKQLELLELWLRFKQENPEETIEIVPNKKWFVRSKERNLEKNYYYFVGKRPKDFWPRYGYKMAAKQFDTKEEAELWTNPLTEAVQLPAEGE